MHVLDVLINSKLLILAISCVLQISFFLIKAKQNPQGINFIQTSVMYRQGWIYKGISGKKNQDGGIRCQHVKWVHGVGKIQLKKGA